MKKIFYISILLFASIMMLVADDCMAPTIGAAKVTLTYTNKYPDGCCSKKALFSVNSNGDQVLFSKGNLQYIIYLTGSDDFKRDCADGTKKYGIFRFAANQYTALKENNQTANAYESMDLLSFGTSGHSINPSNGLLNYNYTSNSYLTHNLVGDANNNYSYDDWGVYNTIVTRPSTGSFNFGTTDDYDIVEPNTWRTLTKEEWEYIISNRPNANNKNGACRIGSGSSYIWGWMLIPDNWICPAGLEFKPGRKGTDTNFSQNSYTLEEWQRMEDAGAIFLPLTGERHTGNDVYLPTQYGRYWSSTYNYDNKSYAVCIYYDGISVGSVQSSYGCAVRLVHDFK